MGASEDKGHVPGFQPYEAEADDEQASWGLQALALAILAIGMCGLLVGCAGGAS